MTASLIKCPSLSKSRNISASVPSSGKRASQEHCENRVSRCRKAHGNLSPKVPGLFIEREFTYCNFTCKGYILFRDLQSLHEAVQPPFASPLKEPPRPYLWSAEQWPPKDVRSESLESVNITLFERRVPAGVLKCLSICTWGEYATLSTYSRWALHAFPSVLRGETEGHLTQEKVAWRLNRD